MPANIPTNIHYNDPNIYCRDHNTTAAQMKITLKLFAEFADYLPAEADGNGIEIAVQSATAHSLCDQYRLPREQVRVVMVNGDFLAPENRDAPLQDGDVVSVWPTIQGG